MTIEKRIKKLEGQLSANEMLLKELEDTKPNQLYFKKFIGIFTTLFLPLSVVLFIFVVIFNTPLLEGILEISFITLMFTIVFSSENSFYMFPYLKKSLGLSSYEIFLHSAEEIRIKIDNINIELEILNKF